MRERVQVRGTNISLRLDQVTNDSRCPEETQCVQAGNAEARLFIKTGMEGEGVLILNTNIEPKVAEFAGRTVTLVALEPVPRAGQTLRQEDYRARLRISSR